MVDFSHLQKEEAKTDTAIEFVIHDLAGKPTLDVLPALPEYNKAFRKEVMRIAENKRALRKASKSDDKELDFEIYAKTVVKGWSGVVDSKGKAVEFNEENCRAYLKAVPKFVFSDLRQFCLDITNWVEDELDTESAAKN